MVNIIVKQLAIKIFYEQRKSEMNFETSPLVRNDKYINFYHRKAISSKTSTIKIFCTQINFLIA